MAKIIENKNGRRIIRISPEDIVSIVREYQNLGCHNLSYVELKNKLKDFNFYIPEDI